MIEPKLKRPSSQNNAFQRRSFTISQIQVKQSVVNQHSTQTAASTRTSKLHPIHNGRSVERKTETTSKQISLPYQVGNQNSFQSNGGGLGSWMDDRTYISVLKSDILLLQLKIEEISQEKKTARKDLEFQLNNLNQNAKNIPCTIHVADSSSTKFMLFEILLEKMMELGSLILEKTTSLSESSSSFSTKTIDFKVASLPIGSSSLSRLPPFLSLVQRILLFQEYLEETKKESKIHFPQIREKNDVNNFCSNVEVTQGLPSENTKLLSDFDILKQRIKEMEGILECQRKEKQQYEVEIESKEKCLKDFREKLRQEQESHFQLKKLDEKRFEEIEKLKIENSDLRRQVSKFAQKIEEEKLDKKTNEGISREKYNITLSELENAKNCLKDSDMRMSELNAKMIEQQTEHKKKTEELQKKYDELKNEMESRINFQTKEDEQSLKRLSQMKSNLSKAEQAFSDLKTESDYLKSELKKFEHRYLETLNQLEEKQKQIKEKETDLKLIEVKEQDIIRLREEIVRYKSLDGEHENLIKNLTNKVQRAEQMLQEKERQYSDLKFSEYKTRKRCEEMLLAMKQREDLIGRLRQDLKAAKQKEVDVSKIMLVMDSESDNFSEILIEELKMMREAFENKLSRASQEIEIMKKNHDMQLYEINQTVKMERQMMAKKVEKLRERCEMLQRQIAGV